MWSRGPKWRNGRRDSLKNCWGVTSVSVRKRPSAHIFFSGSRASSYKKEQPHNRLKRYCAMPKAQHKSNSPFTLTPFLFTFKTSSPFLNILDAPKRKPIINIIMNAIFICLLNRLFISRKLVGKISQF